MPPAPFTPPAKPAELVPGGLLASMKAMWEASGWDPEALNAFRMGPDDDTDDDDDRWNLKDDSDSDDDSDDDADDDDDDDDDGDDAKAPNVKKLQSALDSERSLHRRAKRQLAPWKRLARDLNVTPDQVREALAKVKPSKDDDKPDADAIRREAERDARRSADRRVIGAEVKRLAGPLFKDAADAVRYLKLEDYEVDDDGDVDEDEILADLQELLRKKPHLKKRARKPKPDAAQSKKTEKGKGLGSAGAAEAARRFGDKKQ